MRKKQAGGDEKLIIFFIWPTERYSVKEAFSKGSGIKEMAFWWYFEAILNDSDVKFKIYFKYGNGQICMVCHVTEWLYTCTVNPTVNLQGTVLYYLYILKLFWSTLRDSAMKFKIYCTEIHALSKHVNLSRACGSIYRSIASRTQLELKRLWVFTSLEWFHIFCKY